MTTPAERLSLSDEQIAEKLFKTFEGWNGATIGWQGSGDPLEDARRYRQAIADHRAECKRLLCAILAADRAQQAAPGVAGCWCRTCHPMSLDDPLSMRMILCPDCGNKRCPKANDHGYACTNSNESGQPGSAYPARAPSAGNGDWQTMESAPMDATFLVYLPTEREGRQIQPMVRHKNFTTIGGQFDFDCREPTHWMPLPDAPALAAAAAERGEG